jgi:phenylacetate-CoA ligase
MLWNIRFQLKGSKKLQRWRQLQQWQKLDCNRIFALQQKRLKQLIAHADRHVPYYRQVFSRVGVINKSGTINLSKWPDLPLLEKDTLRDRFTDLTSDDISARKWNDNTSGGSTGQPVRFIQDMNFRHWARGIKMLFDIWTGYSGTAGKVVLWGSIRDLFKGRETPRTRLRRWLNNELWLNAFRMTPEQMFRYVEKITAFKPVQILAYAESLHELSKFIESKDLEVFSPRAIMTSAGTLHPHMRKTIERVFKAPVFNRYGSREVGDIACECNHHRGLHVCVPTHYLEILKDNGTPASAGESGRIIVTLLTNYAMPFIRYAIGDMGLWSEETCSCGRNWPMLQKVTGRVTDVFLKRDGGVVIPECLIHLIGVELNSGWILKYQIVQEDYDDIRVSIVPQESIRKAQNSYFQEKTAIVEKIRLAMGGGCRVEFEMVNKIDPLASGKYRYTISKIAERKNQIESA